MSGARTGDQPGDEDLSRDFAIVERERLPGDDLVGFVAFARDHDGVSAARPAQGVLDGLPAFRSLV